jgi:hypothetical protein
VKMIKTASRRQVQQLISGHGQCCSDMVHSGEYVFSPVFEHGCMELFGHEEL